MSINPVLTPTATAALPSTPPAGGVRRDSADPLSFDRFQRMQMKPNLAMGSVQSFFKSAFHPILSYQVYRSPAPQGAAESFAERVHMFNIVRNSLPDANSRKQLDTLLAQGILNDAKTDDRHSALYHLYSMATIRRAAGYSPREVLRETVEVLSRPDQITQKFSPLSPQAAQRIMQVRNTPGLNRLGIAPPIQPLRWEDLNVDSSATCVASSVMYYMADKEPGELVRHLNELTSPMNAFYEKARLDEISPDDPSQATEILKQHDIKYTYSGPGEVTVRVENPPAGALRAIDSQHIQPGHPYRNAIESAYQSALTHLATRSYDPANDMRDADAPGETSKGLTEMEKTLMETIIKDNGGVQSVTYQAVAGKANPQQGEEGNSYLYGYTRSFEQTTTDLLDALKQNEFVIVGITDTDQSGAIVGGHEITITSAFVDKQDGEVKFVVADSDDGVPSLVTRTARELIPRIHHAGMPLQLARKINQGISQNPGYFVPDQNDANRFSLLASNPEPMPADEASFGPEAVNAAPQAQAIPGNAAQAPIVPNVPQTNPPAYPAQLTQATYPQANLNTGIPTQGAIGWMPVYSYYPAYAAVPATNGYTMQPVLFPAMSPFPGMTANPMAAPGTNPFNANSQGISGNLPNGKANPFIASTQQDALSQTQANQPPFKPIQQPIQSPDNTLVSPAA